MSEMRKLVIVSSTEGILVRALRNKLGSSGVDVVYAGSDTMKIKDTKDKAGIYLIELSDDLDELTYAFSRVKENLTTNPAHVLVVAQQNDQLAFKRRFADLATKVTEWYEHGFDMEEFEKHVKQALSSEAAAAGTPDAVRNILIVDDDPTYAKMVREWLKSFYHVSVVVNAMQAINYMSNHHIDLVLLDYEMPVVTGPQVFEMMKNEPETCNIPVIFLTGVGDAASVAKVIALKPAGYLLKSSTREDIVNKLLNFFK